MGRLQYHQCWGGGGVFGERTDKVNMWEENENIIAKRENMKKMKLVNGK